MSKVESQRSKQSFCQSRFYKSWNPDYIADYNRFYRVLPTRYLLHLNFQFEGQAFEMLFQEIQSKETVDGCETNDT